MAVYKYNELNLEKISYTGINTLKTNKMVTFIGVKYDGKNGLNIQTPEMVSTIGFSEFIDPASGKPSYTLNAIFPNVDNFGNEDYSGSPTDDGYEVGQFYNTIRALQRKFYADAAKNSLEWFKKGKVYTVDQIEDDKMSSMLKYSKDKITKELNGKYSPMLSLKVGMKGDGEFDLQLFNKAREELPNDLESIKANLPKGVRFVAIISLTGLWFSQGKLCPSWKLKLVRTHNEVRKSLSGYAFRDDDAEAEEFSEPQLDGKTAFIDDAELPEETPAPVQETAPAAAAKSGKPRRVKA